MINVQNISSKLASLPDQALKQYAEMHKEDPYVFSLALSESNRRKELRSRTQQPDPQPKVVDKELADMDVRKALPEDLGIARIPVDMNMAGGGIVAFGDGGYVPTYKKDGLVDSKKVFVDQYGPVAVDVGKQLGVDPSILLAQWGLESRFGESTVGQFNVGNIKDFSNKGPKGFDKIEKSNSAYREYDSPEEFGKDYAELIKRNFPKAIGAGADVDTFASGLQNGRFGSYATGKDYGKTLSKVLTSIIPISSAQAETAPPSSLRGDKVSDQTLSSLITGKTQPAPKPQEVDRSITGQLKDIGSGIAGILAPEGAGGYEPGTRNFFERAADQVMAPIPDAVFKPVGGRENLQRNFSNTLNALPGASVLRAPAAVGKLSAAAQVAREAEIAAAAAKAEAAAGKVANIRLPAPSGQQGIASIPSTAPPLAPRTTFPLSPESVEMNKRVQAGRQAQQLRNLEADKAAAEAASKGVTTAQNAAKTSEAMEMANAARAANMANKVINPVNKTLATARSVQAQRNLDTAANKIFDSSDSNSGANTSEYKPNENQDLLKRYPLTESGSESSTTAGNSINYDQGNARRDAGGDQNLSNKDQKAIVKATKDSVPNTEETQGWSSNDWLQFGLALMAGKSPNALTNVGEAGLSLLASKQAKELKDRELDLYKKVHLEKPGETEKSIQRLMESNPSLTYEEALSRHALLNTNPGERERGVKQIMDEKKIPYSQALREYIEGTEMPSRMAAIEQRYAAIAARSGNDAGRLAQTNLKDYYVAKKEIEKNYPSVLRTGSSATSKANKSAYEAEIKDLQEAFGISPGSTVTAPASGWGQAKKQ